VLGALAELIDRQRPRMEAIGSAGSYARALDLAEREQPDVILLSVFQDTLDALGTVAALLRVCSAKVLVLKGMHDPVPVAPPAAHRRGRRRDCGGAGRNDRERGGASPRNAGRAAAVGGGPLDDSRGPRRRGH
jgi:hypothetical protein